MNQPTAPGTDSPSGTQPTHPSNKGYSLRSLAAFLDRVGTDGTAPEFDNRHATLAGKHLHYCPAAVLVGFIPDSRGSAEILLTVRQPGLYHHGGQIAFPGGKLEPQDRNEAAAALRETQEELGIRPDSWHIHGCLPHCFLPSGYRVRPILASSSAPISWQADPAEVADVFRLPASIALDPGSYVREAHKLNGKPLALPVLYWRQYRIWGATAAILHQLAAKALQVA